MPFNSNFTRVTVDAAHALCVEGRSEPPEGATAIFVAVSHEGQFHTARVDNPALIDWEAMFPEGAPGCQVGDEVFVFGVAMRPPPCDPFTWQASFEVEDAG
jgi:Ni,Fe-hydrogenase III large subunit